MAEYFTEASLTEYLDRTQSHESPFRIERLGGGVSALAFICEGSAGAKWVVKQALDNLAVEQDWPAERGRILTEIDAMRSLAPILPGQVPRIIFADQEHFTYGMEAVGSDYVLLKSALLEGNWPENSLRNCGRLLARLHMETAPSKSIQERFASLEHFRSLRIEPYLEAIRAKHTEYEAEISDAIRIALSDAHCLVHGDYSPKNIFVRRVDGFPILLDFEVAHWGNPAFDLAFFMTHPLAKAAHQPKLRSQYIEGIREFWDAYYLDENSALADRREVIRLWGAIAVARVDGKSPLEYLESDEKRDRLRETGFRLLKGSFGDLSEALDVITA